MILKKIFIIASILLLVVAVFFGIYTVAFKSNNNKISKNKTKVEDLNIEEMLSQKIMNVTSDPIIAATIGPDGNTVRYYDALDGRVWTMTLRGTNKEVLLGNMEGIPQSVKWSKSGDAAILGYDNGEVFVYNHATNTSNKLRDGMDDVVWGNMNNKILYKYYDQTSKERSLNIANADGTNWKKLADLPFRYTTFTQIPSSTRATFWPTADANIVTQLFAISTINVNNPKQIFTGRSGANFLFSPDGKNILVSSVSNNGASPTIGIMNSDGKDYNDLQVPTIIKKSVWARDGKTVYYAQPNNVPNNVTWPNDYNDKKFTTQDTFYKMDTTTGKKERIIELDEITEKIDAVDLFLSPSEDILFFTNRTNNLLYKLSL